MKFRVQYTETSRREFDVEAESREAVIALWNDDDERDELIEDSWEVDGGVDDEIDITEVA